MTNYERNAMFPGVTLKSTMLKFSSTLFWTGKQFGKFWYVPHSFYCFRTIDKLEMKLFRFGRPYGYLNSEYKARFVQSD